ncbi:FAD-dependent oxidoreductase [Pseudomonas sp. NA13]
MSSTDKHVGVIGAGVVGVCTALMLQRRGFKVTIIDPDPPGEGASFGNAGCFNGSSVVPMSMPGMIKNVPSWLLDPMGPLAVRFNYLPNITPWLVRFLLAGKRAKVWEQSQALRSLIGSTVPLIKSLAKEAGAEHLLRHEGHLYVYRSESAFVKDRGGWELRNANGISTQTLSAEELREFDPSISSAYTKGVLIAENSHTTNPHELVTSIFRKVLENGGQFLSARATGFALNGEQLIGIETTSGVVSVDAAVVAAGAHSKPLTEILGITFRLILSAVTIFSFVILLWCPKYLPRTPRENSLLHQWIPVCGSGNCGVCRAAGPTQLEACGRAVYACAKSFSRAFFD